MLETDIRSEILASGAVSAIIGTRFFLKDPIDDQTQPYLSFFRQGKTRDMISEKNRFDIFVFHQDSKDLEVLCQAVISALEGKKVLNGNKYYSNSLIAQSDSRVKLDNGFFWSVLHFEFKTTI